MYLYLHTYLPTFSNDKIGTFKSHLWECQGTPPNQIGPTPNHTLLGGVCITPSILWSRSWHSPAKIGTVGREVDMTHRYCRNNNRYLIDDEHVLLGQS